MIASDLPEAGGLKALLMPCTHVLLCLLYFYSLSSAHLERAQPISRSTVRPSVLLTERTVWSRTVQMFCCIVCALG